MDRKPKLSGLQEAIAYEKNVKANLCKAIGVSQQTMQRWIKLDYVPKLKKVEEIAEKYGISKVRLCDPEIIEIFPELLSLYKDKDGLQ